jgi:hypothetical protein
LGGASITVADAANTGLPDTTADVVLGEAMLTMQGDAAKNAIVAEAVRLLRPGGRYGIHELALIPDTVPENIKADIRHGLARSIRVNARPLTVAEWQQLLTGHGLVIDKGLRRELRHLPPCEVASLHCRRNRHDAHSRRTERRRRGRDVHPSTTAATRPNGGIAVTNDPGTRNGNP